MARRYPVATFIVVAFAFSWGWWFAAFRFGVLGDILPPVTAIASFGPALAALLVARAGAVSEIPDARGRHRRTFAVLVLVMGVIFALRLLTGGRNAFREAALAVDVTFTAVNLFLVALVVPYTLLSVVPGIVLVTGLVVHGRMWKKRPGEA